MLVIAVAALISSQSSDKSGSEAAVNSEASAPASEQTPAFAPSGFEEETTEGPPLQELPVYAAAKALDGYSEQARQPGDPPTAAAIRFEVADQPGFFWLSLFDENITHYIDPNETDPPYNKKLYSSPLIGRSCHILISDNETFILRHMTDTPPTTREEIAVAQDKIIFLLADLGSAGIENLGLVQPVPDSPVTCWDSITTQT